MTEVSGINLLGLKNRIQRIFRFSLIKSIACWTRSRESMTLLKVCSDEDFTTKKFFWISRNSSMRTEENWCHVYLQRLPLFHDDEWSPQSLTKTQVPPPHTATCKSHICRARNCHSIITCFVKRRAP